YESGVGGWTIPIQTGMTIGEFASWMNDQAPKRCNLQVIPLEGWRRGMTYKETGLPWIAPSPNMPTLDTVRVYAGTAFFEGTNLSEGRGTTQPFELIGAPWIDAEVLSEEANGLRLPGVYFRPTHFTPTFSKHQGEHCSGVQVHVTDQ